MPSSELTQTAAKRETVSDAIFYGVADAKGVSPIDLQPLGEVIDTDALNRLVASTGDSADAYSAISFAYSGYEVMVFGDETVSLSELEDGPSQTPN